MGLLPKLHICMFAIEQTGFLGVQEWKQSIQNLTPGKVKVEFVLTKVAVGLNRVRAKNNGIKVSKAFPSREGMIMS